VENQVNALPLHLGQYQFDAVVSFCFNVGIGKFKKSTLYKKIRADAYDSSIPAEFKKWIYGGGKILPGLVTRREWEAKRYQGLTI
ncbi:lysozyme, partial [Bacteroides thetaiotaomicron]